MKLKNDHQTNSGVILVCCGCDLLNKNSFIQNEF